MPLDLPHNNSLERRGHHPKVGSEAFERDYQKLTEYKP